MTRSITTAKGKVSKNNKKKVLVLGVEVDRHPNYQDDLADYDVMFASCSDEALVKSKGAHVVAANINHHRDFFRKLIERGYTGGVVAITNSRKDLTIATTLANGDQVFPVTCRQAPGKIIQALATATS